MRVRSGRYLLLLTILTTYSCIPTSEHTKFDHRLLSLSYPTDWIVNKNESQLLSISKYGEFNSMFFKYNPNVSIYVDDTISLMNYYGSYNFSDDYERLKNYKLENENTFLLNEFQFTKNSTAVTIMTLEVVAGSKDYLQTIYCFESFENFVIIVCTDNYSEPNLELEDIIKSLEIPANEQVIDLLQEVVLE